MLGESACTMGDMSNDGNKELLEGWLCWGQQQQFWKSAPVNEMQIVRRGHLPGSKRRVTRGRAKKSTWH